MTDEFDDLCTVIAAESGRPPAEIATLELLGAADALRWLAEHARGLLGAHRFALPRALHPLTRASAGHSPVGVVGIAGAAGAPFALPLCAVGAALLGGNGAIVAPGSRAPLAGGGCSGCSPAPGCPRASSLVRVRRRAGGLREPAGSRGWPERAGLDDRAGRRQARPRGGRGDLGGLRRGRPLQRVYVGEQVFEDFREALCRAAGEVALGDPLAPHTQLGPLAGEAVATMLEAAIAQAAGLGGVVHTGGRRVIANPSGVPFFAPAVLSGVPATATLARSRVDGPVLVLTSVSGSEEAATLANGGERSLGASIWSADRRRAVRIARELQARVVWGNDHVPAMPLRQAAADALERCGRAQLITWEPAGRRPPWRYRYDGGTQRAARPRGLHSTGRASASRRCARATGDPASCEPARCAADG